MKQTLYVLPILALATASTGFAQTGLEVTSMTEARMAVPTAISVDGSVDSNTKMNKGIDADSNTEASIQLNIDPVITTEEMDDDSSEDETTRGDEMKAEAKTQGAIKANRDQIRAFMELYAEANADAEDVEEDTETNATSVTINDNGKFLGIFKTNVEKRVSLSSNDDGEVTIMVKKPWWSFLVWGQVHKDLDSEVKANLMSSLAVN